MCHMLSYSKALRKQVAHFSHIHLCHIVLTMLPASKFRILICFLRATYCLVLMENTVVRLGVAGYGEAPPRWGSGARSGGTGGTTSRSSLGGVEWGRESFRNHQNDPSVEFSESWSILYLWSEYWRKIGIHHLPTSHPVIRISSTCGWQSQTMEIYHPDKIIDC